MLGQIRRSVVLCLIALVLFGLVYPLAGVAVSQLLFRHQADGSVTANGSTLIGQNWTGRAWFHGRPDDTGPYAADPATHSPGGDNPLEADNVPGESAASNLGPRSQVLVDNTEQLVKYWHQMGVPDPTPDLVTTSGSGLDPDISPADALVQVPMVSKATGIPQGRLRALIARDTHGPQLGFLTPPFLVVLQLNEDLARLK